MFLKSSLLVVSLHLVVTDQEGQGLYNFTFTNKISPPMSNTPQTAETAMTMTVVEKVAFGSLCAATVTLGLGL